MRLGVPRVWSALIAVVTAGLACSADGLEEAEGDACGLHGCYDADEDSAPKADGSTVHVEIGESLVVIGDELAVEAAVADLDALAMTTQGANTLATLDELAPQLEGRITLRPRPDAAGDETTCANTVFRAGGFDLRRAQAIETSVDDVGRVMIVEPGESLNPSTIRIMFNRECQTVYDDGTPCAPPMVFLFHELLHAQHAMQGEITNHIRDNTDPMPGGSNHEEARTIGRGAYAEDPDTENALRRELALPQRNSHATLCAPRP